VVGLAASLSLVGARPALAQKTQVAVLPFTGPGAAAARQGVLQGLGSRFAILAPAAYARAAKKLHVDGATEKGVLKVCKSLKCDAVVSGAVKKKRRKHTLTVVVRDGGSGRVLGKKAQTVKGAGHLAAAGATIGQGLDAFIEKGHHPEEPAPKVKGRGRGKTGPVAAAPAPAPAPAPEPAPAPAPAPAPESYFETTPAPRIERKAETSKRSLDLFEVQVALGMVVRRASLKSDTVKDSSYEGGAFSEILLRLDLYPLGPFVRGFARNIGIGLAYNHHLAVSTSLVDSTGEAVKVSTTSQEFLVDLRVRWAFLQKPTSPVLLVYAGFGLTDFKLGENAVLTSLEYRFLRFGIEGLVPILTPLIAVTAGVDVRPLLTVGQSAIDSLGRKSGGFAYALRAGLAGKVSFGLTYFATFEWLSHSVSFDGRTDITADQSVPPDRLESSKLSDGYIRFYAGLGYAL
jgi:hypothetical protein